MTRTHNGELDYMRDAVVAKVRHAFLGAGLFDVCPCGMSDCQNFRDGRMDAPLMLDDVLRAIEKAGLNDQVQYHEILFKLIVSSKRLWHLGKSLDENPQAWEFLYKILGCEKVWI